MRFSKSLLSASGIALIATLGLAAPANASDADTDRIEATQPLAAPESSAQAGSRVALEHLVGTQTDEEIEAIMSSDEEAEALADPATGKILAARYSEPTVSLFAITQRGPGCATTDACAHNGYNYGYYGTGQKTIDLRGVTSITSGDKSTGWWQGSNVTLLGPNKKLLFGGGGAHLTSITRS